MWQRFIAPAVLYAMLSISPMTDDFADAQAFRVRRPRASDAVGGALRAVFGEVPALPEEMLAALRRIDIAARGR